MSHTIPMAASIRRGADVYLRVRAAGVEVEQLDVGAATPYLLFHRIRTTAVRPNQCVLGKVWRKLVEIGAAPARSVPWLARLPLDQAIRLGEATNAIPFADGRGNRVDPRLQPFIKALTDLLMNDLGYPE